MHNLGQLLGVLGARRLRVVRLHQRVSAAVQPGRVSLYAVERHVLSHIDPHAMWAVRVAGQPPARPPWGAVSHPMLQAGCGWCQDQGCVEGDREDGSPNCPAGSWHFTRCPVPQRPVTFSVQEVVLGLTFTIGAGLVVGTVGVFVVFVRRRYRQQHADQEYARRAAVRSCTVCGDMLAASNCSVCDKLFCRQCAPDSVRCKRGASHRLVPVVAQDQNDHYTSFRYVECECVFVCWF